MPHMGGHEGSDRGGAICRLIERSTAPGYAALARLLGCIGEALPQDTLPPFTAEQFYYPATPHLLAATAAAEIAPYCLA